MPLHTKVHSGQKFGFTLLDLLLSIGIIAIIASITIVTLNPAKQLAQARNTQRRADIASIVDALGQYVLDNDGNSDALGVDMQLRMIGTAADGCSISCSGTLSAANAFVDDTQTEFDTGAYSGTDWETGLGVGLDAGTTGSYTSGVKDANQPVTWTIMSWIPRAPYGKPLPDNSASESAYTIGNANMSSNGALWHLNESSGQLADSSGNGKNSTVVSGVTYGTAGQFGTALSFDGNDYVDFPPVFSARVGFPQASSVDELTATAWFRTSTPPPTTGVVLWQGKGGSFSLQLNDTGIASFWIKQTKSNGTNYNGSWHGLNSSPTSYADGAWHHIAGRYHRTNNTISLIVDGVLLGTYTGMNPNEFLSYPTTNHPTIIGASSVHPNGRVNFFTGDIDEVSMFSNAFSDSEVQHLYRRGALRLTLQAHTCDDPTCTGVDFVGPDTTTATFFEETTSGTTDIDLSAFPANRYFQYRATFTSAEAGESPDLLSVSAGNDGEDGEEITADACADLTDELSGTYLAVLPFDPKDGSSNRSYYAAKQTGTGRFDVRSCTAELQEEISVVQ